MRSAAPGHLLVLIGLWCAGFLMSAQASPNIVTDVAAGLVFEGCEAALSDEDFLCARYQTGNGHALRVVVVNADSVQALSASHPILFVHGGPGYPFNLNPTGARFWQGWLRERGIQRPVVLFDQRGTGQSRPAYQCAEYQRAGARALTRNLTAAEEYDVWWQATTRCRERIRQQGFRLDDFSSAANAADALGIMQSLEAERWDLLAMSYGTRVAMQMLQSPAPGLDAVVLDSVLPQHRSPLDELPWLLAGTLGKIFAACRDDEACAAMLPAPEQQLFALLARLYREPVVVPARGGDGKPLEVVVHDRRLLEGLFHGAYSMSLVQRIPTILKRAGEGDSAALAPLMHNLVSWIFDPGFNPPVYYAIACSERSALEGGRRFAAGLRAYPAYAPYIRLAREYDLCRAWDIPPAGDAAPLQVKWTGPVLLLSGGFDPVTPSIWAAEFANQLETASGDARKGGESRVSHYIGENQSHIVMESDPCAGTWVAEFLDNHRHSGLPVCASTQPGAVFDAPTELSSD